METLRLAGEREQVRLVTPVVEDDEEVVLAQVGHLRDPRRRLGGEHLDAGAQLLEVLREELAEEPAVAATRDEHPPRIAQQLDGAIEVVRDQPVERALQRLDRDAPRPLDEIDAGVAGQAAPRVDRAGRR